MFDSIVQAFFAFLLAWFLWKGEKRPWIPAGMALLPIVMDLDHLLSTYASGIKAFHSLAFVYLISGSMLAYGYLKGSENAKKLGVISFAVLMLSISMDLLEGGKIALFYPFTTQAYALPYFGASQLSRTG